MPSRNKIFRLVAVVVCGLSSGIAGAGHGPHPAGQCYSPLGVPCAPKRESYGYFPTIWRRWPIEQPETIAPREPETLPTPAEQPSPAIVSDGAGTVPSGPGPTPPSPVVPEGQPPESPLAPPFEDAPLKSPSEVAPLPSPFDDAPPGLPDAADSPSPPPMKPQPTTEALPSNDLPAQPEKQPAADADLPPTMPSDDPFKDDPESEVGPPPDAAPKSSANTPDELHRVLQQSAAKWNALDVDPYEFDTAQRTQPNNDIVVAPRRLEMDAANAPPEELPGPSPRANPLRSASQTSRKQTMASTASFSSPRAEAPGGEGSAWRRNPLRSR